VKTETPEEQRGRVSELVTLKFPQPLDRNDFANAVLDIIRGGHDFQPDDRLEALDALAWLQLTPYRGQ